MTIQVLGTFINSYQKTFGQNFITDDFFFVYVGLASNILNGSSRMVWGKLYDIKGFKVSIEKIFGYHLLYLCIVHITVNRTERLRDFYKCLLRLKENLKQETCHSTKKNLNVLVRL